MVMLTEVLRFRITDRSGRSAKLEDLCIALLEDDYPPITHLLFQQDGKLKRIDWTKECIVDKPHSLIRIPDLTVAADIDANKDVLLKRDILDALVIDLLGRRTTRVCDLFLEFEEGALRLKGVDAGLAAMLRRVTGGRIGRVSRDALFDWKYVEFLRGDPHAVDNGEGYRLRITRLPAGEIARLADYVPYLHAAELLKLLPDEKAAEVLEATSIQRQVQIIEELDETEAIDIICLMSSDLAADLLGRLQVDTMRRWLQQMPRECREKIIELLRYPENSVGGVMMNNVISIEAGLTGKDAKAIISERLLEADFGSVIFLVEDGESRKLKGTLDLRELIVAGDDQVLEDIMDPYVETLDPYDSAATAAFKIVDGQLSAMPVVNKQGRLLGAMTVDSAISQLVPETSGLQTLRVFS